MIGIVYVKRRDGAWHCAGIGCLPYSIFKRHSNESFWLFPWVAQDMCWNDRNVPTVADVVLS